ncbi:hypothetical protein KAR91_07885 [Candidatus Pacearchaeota archaeon]|nr:hypothetical protein [Candidatus Pacearchaeota archaeon]
MISDAAKKIYTLTELVQNMNKAWHECGQTGDLSILSDNIEVTESEVKMKFQCVLTVTVNKDSVDLSSLEAVNPSVIQSSSQK